MSSDNPFVNPPRLPPPAKGRLHARKPSRSPVREHARDHDPMLRNLSPSTTLRAFISDPAQIDPSDALAASIHSSSTSERALGAKAAKTCLDLRAWTREMEKWDWPGTFDIPEPARKKMRMTEAGSNDVPPRAATGMDEGEEVEYWGSLPARTVQSYEKRADEIGHNLDEVDVEDLKDYVLNSHYRVDSRPGSRADSIGASSIISTTDYKRLDDFTALVTATILQALPFLTRLNRLLDVWTIRLMILRSAPSYLRDLRLATMDLDHGWTVIRGLQPADARAIARFDRRAMLEMKSKFEHQVGSLGRRLDRLLDNLEGRDDIVPDTWIDDFEALESTYGSWVVHAERKVLESESIQKIEPQSEVIPGTHEIEGSTENPSDPLKLSELEDSALDEEAVVHPKIDQSGDVLRDISISPPLQSHSHLSLSIPDLTTTDFSDNQSSATASATSSRADTPGSLSKEEGVGQVAKRRAAFLHDIEINNSLKQSKSPVRPFEHASSAFTRLFKKDRSPEQIRPKRPTSTRTNSANSREDSRSPLDRSIGATVSTAGSKWNAVGSQSFALSRTSSLPITRGTTAEIDTDPKKKTIESARQVQQLPQRPRNPRGLALVEADAAETPASETSKARRLSSPFRSPGQDGFPENLPLASQTADEAKPDASVVFLASDGSIQGPGIEANSNTQEINNSCKSSGGSVPFEPSPLDFVSQRDLEQHPAVAIAAAAGQLAPLPEAREARSPLAQGSETRSSSSPPATPGSSNAHFQRREHSDDEVEVVRPYLIKRASTTSIETFSRSAVKSIDVHRSSRQGSASSKTTPPQTPQTTAVEAGVPELSFPAQYKDIIALPTPSRRSSLPSVSVTPEGETLATFSGVTESSPLMTDLSESPLGSTAGAPLNGAMTKRRGKSGLRNERTKPWRPASPATLSAKEDSYFPAPTDTFDRHVSEVLETLPGQIRFKPRPGAETPVPRAGDGRGYNAPRPKLTMTRAPTRTGMTIVPAETSPKKSSSASDPEVKLYHLTQAGRDEPIKLFVRLVGEGERVMVRVGGGWADLADYLRQYAEHHGSRTVSEGNFEVQNMQNTHSRRVSGTVELKAKTLGTPNGTPRPSSNDSEKEFSGRIADGRSTPIRYSTNGRQTPNGLNERQTPNGMNGRQTPTSVHSSTPKSSSGSSRPSTANVSRPPSRQNMDVGLAGPSSGKKGNLPEHKAKWVEGMIERAKLSAEKSKEESQKYFGELGKAGGTRRVIFRSSSGVGTGERK